LGLNEIIIDISSRELLEEYIKKNLNISDEETLFEIFRAIDKVSKKGKIGVKEEYKEKIKEEILEEALTFAEKKRKL